MKWKTTITNNGVDLVSKSVVSGDVVFTKALCSTSLSGLDDLKAMTDVSTPKLDSVSIKSVIVDNKNVKITVRITNVGCKEEYTVHQIGVFAKLTNTSDEVLFSISESEMGEIIPTADSFGEYVCDITFIVIVDRVIRTSVISGSTIYAEIGHKHTVDDITDLPETSNKNLFNNAAFKINTQGKSVYNTPNSYCLDRWVLQNSGTSEQCMITVNNSGIEIKNTDATNVGIYQIIEQGLIQANKKYTMSAQINGKWYSTTLDTGDPSTSLTSSARYDDTDWYATLLGDENGNYHAYPYITFAENQDVIINAVKLELGEHPTPYVPDSITDEIFRFTNMNSDGTTRLSGHEIFMTNEIASNRNLLYNANFAINTIGKMGADNTYTYTSDMLGDSTLFIDSWRTYISPKLIITSRDGIAITAGDREFSGIFQSINEMPFVKGQTITPSIWINETPGSNWCFTIQVHDKNDNGDTIILCSSTNSSVGNMSAGLNTLPSITIPKSGRFSLHFYIYANSTETTTISVRYAKAEMGKAATVFTPDAQSDKSLSYTCYDGTEVDCMRIRPTGMYRSTNWKNYPPELPDGQGTLVVLNYIDSNNNSFITYPGTIGEDICWLTQLFISPRAGTIYQMTVDNKKSTGWIKLGNPSKIDVLSEEPTNPEVGYMYVITHTVKAPDLDL